MRDQAAAGSAAIVIEASGINEIDYTGSHVLQAAVAELRLRGIEAVVAQLSAERSQAQAERSGLLEALGPAGNFHSVAEAIKGASHPRS